MKRLKASVGKVVITPPPVGTPMTGNTGRDTKSRGVPEDIYCNILILNDDSTKVCLLGFDNIGLEYATCNDIKNRIEKATDIPAENIVMWSTLVHSTIDTGMCQKTENSRGAFFEKMSVKVIAGVAKANERYEEVILKTGKTNVADLSFNGCMVKNDGSVVTNIEEFRVKDIVCTSGPVDEELITLSVWDKNDRLFALLVNFALQPAILVKYQWLISRDYINYLDDYIIENYGSQAITLFANGIEGNINHFDYQNSDQAGCLEEPERAGRKLGAYVRDSISNSSVLDGKIRFIEYETVLQGMAIHNFAFVTFPGEAYAESELKIKELSPYKNTMVISLANSESGYVHKKDLFLQEGCEDHSASRSLLVHDADDTLVNLVKEKILDNLLGQSIKTIERKASDNKYLHKDFHIALNLLMSYLYDNFGKDALINYLKQYSQAYYKPLNQKLKSGDREVLVAYFKDIYKKEEWPVRVISHENSVEITQDACPAISHIVGKGGKPCPYYRETYSTVYTTICENTPFEYVLEYFNEETGACKQIFYRKEVKQ